MYPFLMCFGGLRLSTSGSSPKYKPWKEVRAPFDHYRGVYEPGTIPWGVYGRNLLREWLSFMFKVPNTMVVDSRHCSKA